MPPIRSVTLRILGDGREARAVMDWTNAEADKLDKRKATLHIDADASKAQGPLGTFRAEVARLTDKFYTFKFNANDSQLNAQLAAMMVKLAALQRLSDRWGAGQNVTNKSLGEASAKVLGLSAAYDTLVISQQKAVDSAHAAALDEAHSAALLVNARRDTSLAAAFAALPPKGGGGGGGGGFGGRGFGILGGAFGAQVPLFGGLAQIGGLHLLIDGLVEAAAVALPAATAVTAFAAALTATGPVLTMMYQREKNMYIATDLLGQNFPGLKVGVDSFTQALKPGVFQVWGNALTIVNSNVGTFQGMAKTAVDWVDRFAARMTVDLTKGGSSFKAFVASGVHDLNLLGVVFGHLGNALVNMFKVAQTTHIAEDLLGILGIIAKLVDWVTKLPQPILIAAVALHGLYVYGGLAVTGLAKLFGMFSVIPGLGGLKVLKDIPGTFDAIAAKSLSTSTGLGFMVKGMRGVAVDAEGATVKTGLFKTSLSVLSAVPVWGWVAAGTIAVAALGLAFLKTGDSVTRFTDSLNKGITAASNDTVFNMMATDVGKVNNQLAQVGTHSGDVGKALASGFQVGSASAKNYADTIAQTSQKVTGDQSALRGENQKLITQMGNFGTGVGYIMKTFGVDYPTAIAIANQANVKLANGIMGNSKAAEVARQSILGLVSGFAQLQTPAGIAGKDFEALAFASNDITQKIDSLNSAWKTWLGTVTGSQTSFDTFAQGMEVLKNDAGTVTLHLGLLKLKTDQTKTGVDSLSASGINLNQAFMAEVGNLSSLEASMRSANASQKDQNTTMKAGIAALIPFAAGSKEATSVLFALAQQANYTGNDSIKGLAAWAGIKSPAALKIMKKAADDATVAASNLANTIQNLLNVQFQNDVIEASGASSALKKYTTDLVNNRDKTRAGQTDRQNLINDLIHAGLKADAARRYVDGLSTSLGKIPKTEKPSVIMTGFGKFTISDVPGGITLPGTGGRRITGNAAGWRVPGYGGGDKYPAYLEGGEAVVPKHLVAPIAPFLGAHGVPGFESGTFVGSVPGLTDFTTGMWGKFQGDMAQSMMTAMSKALAAAIAAAGSGSDIVRYAESFLGKIPYVMGGNSMLSGIDCSGFVQQVYRHFGIGAPRTSETQGAWVKRSPPTPGGLAFYHSPPGGPDPGHVAIVASRSTVISQGGGMGPKMESLGFLPLLWTGVPPGGLPVSGGGGGNGPTSAGAAQAQAYARSRLSALGEMVYWPSLLALWNQESGWNRFARNSSSGAYGIPQALPPGKMGAAANPPTSSAGAQIDWGLSYIASRYGNPGMAEAHEKLYNWYDSGGWLPRGLSLALNTTGQPEMVTPLNRVSAHHGGGGGDIYITVNAGAAVDPNAVAQSIHQMLRRYKTKKGGGPLGLD
jgi:cell wall-associated NlpC family hydrolase